MIYSLVYGKDGDDMAHELKHFRFWCQKVLPLVYDDSLSYYEVLCKVVNYINKIIDDMEGFVEEAEKVREEIAIIQEWIDNFDYSKIEKVIQEIIATSLATMIFVELDDSGYFIYYIPKSWDAITFNTTGYDIFLTTQPEYGHLVLSY